MVSTPACKRNGNPIESSLVGRRRKAWLVGGDGVRWDGERRIPGWYAAWHEYAGGKRIGRKRKFDSARAAREWVKRYNAMTDLRLIGETLPLTLMEAGKEYLAGHAASARDTRHSYRQSILAMIGVVGDLEVSSITGAHIDRVIATKAGRTTSTVAKLVRNLHAFFTWAVERRYADTNPVKKATAAPRKSTKRIRPELTDAMVSSIVDSLESEHQRLAVLVAATTGMDRDDIVDLTPEMIHGDSIVTARTKTGKLKRHVIPIHPELSQRLRALAAQTRPGMRLLAEAVRDQLAKTGGGDWWRRACNRLGYRGLLFRDLRAYATVRLMRSPGMTLGHARDLLGHASIQTTADHYSIPDSSMQQALRSLPLPTSAGTGTPQPSRPESADR